MTSQLTASTRHHEGRNDTNDMSDTFVEIVARAVNDEAFRHLLLSNPQEALEGYALTDEERALLSEVTEDNFVEFAGSLDDRTTKGWVPGT